MKKFTRMMAFVLTMALVLCSFVMPVSATGTTSKWTVNNGSITNETSEVYIVETVTVEFSKTAGSYIQYTEKLTDLIGEGGKDGKGFVNVLIEDGSPEKTNTHGYAFLQFIGSASTTEAIARDGATDKGITWYIAGHSTTNGRIDNHNGTVAMDYGPYTSFSKAGYQMAFSKMSDGKVYVRGTGTGMFNSATNYTTNEAKAVASSQTLAAIKGDNNETGEDGVYLRLQTNKTSDNLECTITVALPRPANYDYDASHWTLSNGGGTILNESVETWYLDTVTASYAGPDGYVQHNVKHTDLIGTDGRDGKGWVNIIVDDGTKGSAATQKGYEAHGYNLLQLVADPTTASLGAGAFATNTKAMTWYLRTNTPSGGAGLYPDSAKGSNYKIYTGDVDKLLGAGQRFVFTQNSDGKVQLRGNGIGADSTFNDYDDTVTHASQKKLSELAGANNTTGADGVYVRVENERDTATFPVTVSVFYKGENPAPVAPSATPSTTPSATVTPGQTPNQPTGDSSIALIVVAMVLCAGAIVVMAKKRSHAK